MSLNLDPVEANYVYCSIICQLITDGDAKLENITLGIRHYLETIKESVGTEEPKEGSPEYNLKYYANNYFAINKDELH